MTLITILFLTLRSPLFVPHSLLSAPTCRKRPSFFAILTTVNDLSVRLLKIKIVCTFVLKLLLTLVPALVRTNAHSIVLTHVHSPARTAAYRAHGSKPATPLKLVATIFAVRASKSDDVLPSSRRSV